MNNNSYDFWFYLNAVANLIQLESYEILKKDKSNTEIMQELTKIKEQNNEILQLLKEVKDE